MEILLSSSIPWFKRVPCTYWSDLVSETEDGARRDLLLRGEEVDPEEGDIWRREKSFEM